MHRQVGDLKFTPDGIACRGLLVRHLVMPGLPGESRDDPRLAGPRDLARYVREHHGPVPAGAPGRKGFGGAEGTRRTCYVSDQPASDSRRDRIGLSSQPARRGCGGLTEEALNGVFEPRNTRMTRKGGGACSGLRAWHVHAAVPRATRRVCRRPDSFLCQSAPLKAGL